MMAGVQVWLKSATVTTGAWLTHMGQRVANALTSTASFITFLPEILYNYVLTVPVVGNFTQWIATHVRCFQKSTTFIFIRETIISAGQVLHKVISLLYSDEGNVYSQVAGGGVWNVYIPLPECGHSLFDVWHYVGGSSHPSWHQVLLSSAVYRWWHLLTHPAQLIHYFTPPFRAQGAIIGNTHFLSLDGRIFSLSSSCAHVLITDARDGLFTLISNWNHTLRGRDYLLVLGNVTLKLAPDLQVIIDDTPVSLPYIRRMVSVKRDVHHLVMTAKDPLERDMITLTCWTSQHACIVSISGWFHAHTRGLLGNLNLDPSDDFMRPSGKMAVSKGIFSESWHLGSQCFPEKAETEIPPSSQQKVLCYKFLLHYASPVFSCHEAVNVMPFFDTCNQHLASLQHKLNQTKADIHVDITRGVVAAVNTSSFMYSTAQGSDSELLVDVNKSKNASVYHITPDKISVLNILFPFTRDQDDIVDASMEEVAALCDVMAAYSTVCSEQDINFALPQLCGGESLLTYQEPLSPVQQLDLLMLVNEDKCDSFIYQHLIRPLPSVLERIAHGKNLSDIYIGVLGYGSGSGDVMYHTFGASFLTSVSQFRITQPWNNERAQGSLLQGLRAVSTFPFRPGSVRIAFVVSCDNQDLPKFTETLPREMVQRRLSLFTLTPELLLFSPGRPKAVRNTVGMDRWRVYNLRLDSQETHDLRVRRPDSNIAQLALKSGGGVFSITALREDDRAAYYMKLFRRVLSRAFVKVVSNAYKQQRASSVN
ncbi:apolipophorins [Cherax quadricarinatus]